MQADPKSDKKTVNQSSFFALLGSPVVKAVRKHIDEIDPRRRVEILRISLSGRWKTMNKYLEVDFSKEKLEWMWPK